MTTLIIITLAFLCILLILCIAAIVHTLVSAKEEQSDHDDVYVMLFSLIALAMISISFITFYKLIF